ncbi:methyltransferase domain-containing protein [Frankia sp. R82]|uniref:methyltransferase domain-containing protein n=1 Tax=Frankia sp. R82 TaxID=2950553 RepID=UPI002042FC20|nr:methyltransferase domain-containing protein [Frankia sp. R82]MCM3883120.1 protein-L-isoaspartate(D-aspartate) O-methyltransferase [Frankia sp. R82]
MTAPWRGHARALADTISHPGSRWYPVISVVPRHQLVPRWWLRSEGGWVLRQGLVADAYSDRTLVTRVGSLHADQATKQTRPQGRPTSSAILPSLVLAMYQHARLNQGQDILSVGTGSGYGAALLARRYGAQRVTTVDTDRYLVAVAAKRLDALDLHPTVLPVSATGPLPGSYDRIISLLSVPSIPVSWLVALRLGGRLVTTISDTHLILTAMRRADGVVGQIVWGAAAFMSARSGFDYPPLPAGVDLSADWQGEVSTGRYPIVNISTAWETATMLTLTVPGVRRQYRRSPNRRHTVLLTHPDGSWARAEATGTDAPTVHQEGPRRLWDLLDDARDDLLSRGAPPWIGARARVNPDGSIHLSQQGWTATIPATD